MSIDSAEPANPAGETVATGGSAGSPAMQGELRPLHPDYAKVLRIRTLVMTLPILIAALVIESAQVVWPGAILLPALILLGLLVLRLPTRRYRTRFYAIDDEQLRVVRGLLFRADTVVPFGRVQHIDLNRDPVERYYGLSTLTVHTAGSHNASVRLPGLEDEEARAMRETIRAHIGREKL